MYYERMKRKRFHTMDERIVDNSIGGNLNSGTVVATQPQAGQIDNDQELVDLTSGKFFILAFGPKLQEIKSCCKLYLQN